MSAYAVLPKLDRPNAVNFSTAFDRYVQIVSFAVHNKRRIDSKSVSKLTNACLRSAQRYLMQLEREKLFAELYKQKDVQFDDFIAFGKRGKQKNSSLDQEKIKALEMENKELKRQLAFKVLTYK